MGVKKVLVFLVGFFFGVFLSNYIYLQSQVSLTVYPDYTHMTAIQAIQRGVLFEWIKWLFLTHPLVTTLFTALFTGTVLALLVD